MLSKRAAKKFLEDNKEALVFLSEKVRQLEKGRNTKYCRFSQDARWLAAELIEEFITECFGIAYTAEMELPFESDNLYLRLDEQVRKEGRDGLETNS